MKRNLVGKILGKIKIFVQDFVPIRTALIEPKNKGTARVGGGDPIERPDAAEAFGAVKSRVRLCSELARRNKPTQVGL